MDARDFLTRVAPTDLVLIGAKKLASGGFRHAAVLGVDALIEALNRWDSKAEAVYFALGGFNEKPLQLLSAGITKGVRTKANVAGLRSFWVDIDIRPDAAHYTTYEAAIAAVDGFCAATTLPRPLLVDSGSGLHCYWCLEETRPVEWWAPLAVTLKELLRLHGIKGDLSKTADCASVLRPVGWYNNKYGKQVEVLDEGEAVGTDVLALTIDAAGRGQPIEIPRMATAALGVNSDLLGGLSAAKDPVSVLQRCQALRWAYENQELVPEPLWFAGLTVLSRCTDARTWAHQFSALDTARYSPEAVDAKLELIGMTDTPATCAVIEGAGGKCSGCPHRGAIKSPIVFGLEGQLPMPLHPGAKGLNGASTVEVTLPHTPPSTDNALLQYLPRGYKVTAAGELFRRKLVTQEGATEKHFVDERLINGYLYPLYWLEDYSAQDSGGNLVITVAFEYREVGKEPRRFRINMKSRQEAIHSEITGAGIAFVEQTVKDLTTFVRAYLENLKSVLPRIRYITHFGWDDAYENFSLGTHILTPKHHLMSELHPSLKQFPPAEAVEAMGSPSEWFKIWSAFDNPVLADQAFLTTIAWGAPIVRWTNESAAWFHLVGETGSGKSFTLKVIASVYANPRKWLLNLSDTRVSIREAMGFLKNLPPCFDEVQGKHVEEFGEFLYSMTQSRTAMRGNWDKGVMGIGKTREFWLIGVSNSNVPLSERLAVNDNHAQSEAQLYRFVELHSPKTAEMRLDARASRTLDMLLQTNYGHAGPVYIEYIVKNQAALRKQFEIFQEEVVSEFCFSAQERFVRAAVSAMLFGGVVASHLGLHPFKPQTLIETGFDVVHRWRRARKQDRVDDEDLLLNIFLSHIDSTLVIDSKANALISMPRASLQIRIDPGEKMAYITRAFMREAIGHAGGSWEMVHSGLRARGLIMSPKDGERYPMARGTALPGMNTMVYKINLDHPAMHAIQDAHGPVNQA